jgi:hypothetical protein
VAEAQAAWREEIAFAERFTRDHDPGFAGRDSGGEPVSLRELPVHMTEEHARRNGHADLLRERIDGRVGQLRSRAAAMRGHRLLGARRLRRADQIDRPALIRLRVPRSRPVMPNRGTSRGRILMR